MARPDSITSTEKLLETIRRPSLDEVDTAADEFADDAGRSSGTFINRTIRKRGAVTVGVDIGYRHLRLAKISRADEKDRELLALQKVPIDPNISRDSLEFAKFLRKALINFCGADARLEIWAAISSARVDLRCLRIPRLPGPQVANAVYWSYKKEVTFEDDAVVFDFQILGDINEEGIRKTEAIAYTAPRSEVAELRTLFDRSGFPLTGITVFPFAFQNTLKTGVVPTDGNNLCCLYIGRNWSRIDLYSQETLVLSRGIKAGMNSMVEALREGLTARIQQPPLTVYGANGTTTEETLEAHESIESDQVRQVLLGLGRDYPPMTPAWEDFDLTENDVHQMIEPAVERLVRQVERTLAHYALHFDDQVISRIHLSGEVGVNARLLEHVGQQLGVESRPVDVFAAPAFIAPTVEPPPSMADRDSFAPCVGLALSNNDFTPNFLHTYRAKAKQAKIVRVNRLVFAVFICCMALCGAVYFWQNNLLEAKAERIERMQQQALATAAIDQKMILKLVLETKQKQKALHDYSRRYMALALISELAQQTPRDIHLIRFQTDFGQIGQKDKDTQSPKQLILEGVVTGERQAMEASLATFLVRLKSLPVFGPAVVREKTFESYDDSEALRFVVQFDLV